MKSRANKYGHKTTNLPISGGTANTGGIKENTFKHVQLSEDKNIISSHENQDRFQAQSIGNHKRKNCNPSSEMFLNINARKSFDEQFQGNKTSKKQKCSKKLKDLKVWMKKNMVWWWFWLMNPKIVKERRYKLARDKEVSKEHFEPQKQRDFSDLVAHNISLNQNDSEEGLNGLFHLHGVRSLKPIENIQEANSESSSSQELRPKMESFMNRFHDPKSSSDSSQPRGLHRPTSSASNFSNNPNNQSSENLLLNLTQKDPNNPSLYPFLNSPKSRNPTEIIIQQVQETKFLSNTEGISQLNHDSEMVDKHGCEATPKIIRGDTRVVRSEFSQDTFRSVLPRENSTKVDKIARIGKSTRSRNVHGDIRSDDSGSEVGLLKTKHFLDQVKVDPSLDRTLKRWQKAKKRTNDQSTNAQPNSIDELSDFETFRGLNNKDISTTFKSNIKGAFKSSINESDFMVENFVQEKRTRNEELKGGHKHRTDDPEKHFINPPKMMGFFEEQFQTQNMSRNRGIKNQRTDSVHLGKLLSL